MWKQQQSAHSCKTTQFTLLMEHCRRSTGSTERAPTPCLIPKHERATPIPLLTWDQCLLSALTHPTLSMKSSDRLERKGGKKMPLFCNLPPHHHHCCFSNIHLLWWAIKCCYHGNARGCVSIGWAIRDENSPRTAPRLISPPSVCISSPASSHKSEHQVVE